MTKDYGVREKPKALIETPAFQIGVMLATAVVVGVVALIWTYDRSVRHSTALGWTISGPPCPVAADRTDLPRWPAATKRSEFAGVSFTRAVGHVSCRMVGYEGGRGLGTFPVCQFSSPGGLIVTAGERTVLFNPPPGARATVAVPRSGPSCVLNAPAWPMPAEINRRGA